MLFIHLSKLLQECPGTPYLCCQFFFSVNNLICKYIFFNYFDLLSLKSTFFKYSYTRRKYFFEFVFSPLVFRWFLSCWMALVFLSKCFLRWWQAHSTSSPSCAKSQFPPSSWGTGAQANTPTEDPGGRCSGLSWSIWSLQVGVGGAATGQGSEVSSTREPHQRSSAAKEGEMFHSSSQHAEERVGHCVTGRRT